MLQTSLARIGVIAILGLGAYLSSEWAVARHVAQGAGKAVGRPTVTVRQIPRAELPRPVAGIPPSYVFRIPELTVFLDGRTLAVAGVADLDNRSSEAMTLIWGVRVVERIEGEGEPVYVTGKRYVDQPFGLLNARHARPAFADAFTLRAPLPPGKYGVVLSLESPDGEISIERTGWVTVE